MRGAFCAVVGLGRSSPTSALGEGWSDGAEHLGPNSPGVCVCVCQWPGRYLGPGGGPGRGHLRVWTLEGAGRRRAERRGCRDRSRTPRHPRRSRLSGKDLCDRNFAF